MGCRRGRPGSTATLASTNSSRKAEAGSQFAIVGGSTTSISFSRSVPNPCRNSERFLPRRNQPSRKHLQRIKKNRYLSRHPAIQQLHIHSIDAQTKGEPS